MFQLGAEIDALLAQYSDQLVAIAWGVVTVAVVWTIGWALLVPVVGRVIHARNPNNATVARAIQRYLRVIVVAVAVVAGAAAAGYGDLLTGSALVVAAVTLALGVAGQAVIGNLVSGVFLVADPDFNVDDWIAWADGEGVVESISLRVTRVRTQNNEVVIVPNTVLATGQVTRPYGRDDFRVTVELGVDFDEDLPAVMDALREEARDVEGVLAGRDPLVRVVEFGADAVQLRVEFWIRDPDRVDVVRTRSAYLERVVERFDAEGVTISPPAKHELSGAVDVDGGPSDSPA